MGAERTATRATALGAVAVLLWSALALLTVGAKRLPPFQLLALTFAVASALGFALGAWRSRSPWAAARRRPGAALLATAALAGYHFFYFVALRNAPAVDASLIAYLWPLLIVLFAGLAHGGLRPAHLAGAALGLLGTSLVVSTRGTLALDPAYATGYAAAAACALVWSAYSVANRRFADAPVDVVTLACLASALLGAIAHLLFERSVAPAPLEWLAVALLGLGPVGAAFFLWDYGTKHGHLPLLGVFSYAAPVLSTLLLVAAGDAEPSWQLLAAALLVGGGAALASWPRK
jgi:drug/metabolite transporter (DMT)-like permease